MDSRGIGDQLDALVKLAYVGIGAIVLGVFVGVPLLIWWLIRHVSVAFR